MVQLPLHSVNAVQRCFGLNPIIVKGGTHTYNMIKDEQLPKQCHVVVVVVVVFTLKAVPVSTQYFLTSVLVQLTRTPSVVTG